MTQRFYESFDTDTTGSAPPNTAFFSNLGGGGPMLVEAHDPVGGTGKDLEDTVPVNQDYIVWSSPTSAAGDLDIQCDFLYQYTSSSQFTFVGGLLRLSSAGSSSTGYLIWPDLGAGQAYLFEKSGSSLTQKGTTLTIPTFAGDAGTFLSAKFEVSGTTIGFKIWPQGTTEPGSYTGSWTDSSIAGAAGQNFGFMQGVVGAAPSWTVIDNVYMGDVGQSFAPWATTYTISGPSSGYAGAASANFTFSCNPVQSSTTFTLSDGGVGGTFTPSATISVTTGNSANQTFTYTSPVGHDGNITISCSNSGSLTPPANLTYDSLVPVVTVSPVVVVLSQTNATITLTGLVGGVWSTTWHTNPPNWSVSGVAGVSITGHSSPANDSSTMTLTIDTGTSSGTATFTNSVDNSSFILYISDITSVVTIGPFGPGLSGLVGTVGYTVVAGDGSIFASRTTAGISEPDAGSGQYISSVSVPEAIGMGILWDDGQTPTTYYCDDTNPSYT